MLSLTEKVPLLLGGEGLLMLLICVHGGGCYERDLHNCMICTCRFAITVAIMGAGLLGLHIEKSTTITASAEKRYMF